jgi:N-acetylglucosaminyldiphosphoundecaprenol N-acetyl-beta-D-mannosaminyltransferase
MLQPAASTDRPSPLEIGLFGYRLHPMDKDEVIGRIADAVSAKQRLVMANLNVHGMATVYDSVGMASLLAQPDCLTMIDGMPVLFLANFVKGAGLSRDKRTTSLDFYEEMFRRGIALGWQFAYVGGRPQVLRDGLALLRQNLPGLRIDGRDGYFDMTDMTPGSKHAELIDWLRDLSPDVLIVGMGMPRQEEWIQQVQHLIDARVLMPTGAYLDYQVGVQRPAPRWLGRYGLEWIYRLAHSPYRLGHRYLVEPFFLAYRVLTGRPLPGRHVKDTPRG